MLFAFKGDKGFKRILNGNITMESLEGLAEASKDLLEENNDKFEYLNFIHKLLEKPTTVKYVVKKGRVEQILFFTIVLIMQLNS